MKVTYAGQAYDCTKAVRESDKATLYLTDGGAVEFMGVSDAAWEKFQFEGGDWYQPPLEEIKAQRIAQSKADLAAYLESHPIQWTDGERYSITAEKQQQLTGKILSATLAQQTSTPYSLTWNSTGQVCKEWTLEELGKLAFAIDARVTALVAYQQTQEVAMRAAESLEALAAIEVDYDAVG